MKQHQRKILEDIEKEFNRINESEIKNSSSMDLSDIIADVNHRQEVINANKIIKEKLLTAVYEQVDEDIIKLKKIFEPIGFRVENWLENYTRMMYNYKAEKSPTIHITSGCTYTVNSFSKYEHRLTIAYELKYDNSKRNDEKTPCGYYLTFSINSTSSGNHDSIEKLMSNEIVRKWIKEQYENLNIKR